MHAASVTTSNGQVIQGPLLLKPKLFLDERGFFYESWNHRAWAALLINHGQKPCEFVQDNHSCSNSGVLRGLHYQLPPHPQAKLVRCVGGEIFDVAVDIRVGSPTYGEWVGYFLSEENSYQLWIPVGFAHGFLTLSEKAQVLYKTTDFWEKDCERAIRWDDPTLCITWPLDRLQNVEPNLSTKDLDALSFSKLAEEKNFFS